MPFDWCVTKYSRWFNSSEPAGNGAAPMRSRHSRMRAWAVTTEALRMMAERSALVERVLREFGPELLGLRESHGRAYSEVGEFLGLNKEKRVIDCKMSSPRAIDSALRRSSIAPTFFLLETVPSLLNLFKFTMTQKSARQARKPGRHK